MENREGEEGKRPQLSDLVSPEPLSRMPMWSCLFYRDDYYNPDTNDKNIAEIIIAKQRNGPIGTVRLAWIPQYTRFGNEARGDRGAE